MIYALVSARATMIFWEYNYQKRVSTVSTINKNTALLMPR